MDREAQIVALYEAHAGAVKAYALRRSTPDIADDVVSEVFLVAWRRLAEIPSEPRAWLIGTARKVLANFHRAHGRRSALLDRLAQQPVSPPDGEPTAPHNSPTARALAQLSEDDRETVTLIAWDELSSAEAASALGISRGTFAVRLHRARYRFAKFHAAELDRLDPEAPSSSPSTTRVAR